MVDIPQRAPRPAPVRAPRTRGKGGYFVPIEKDLWKILSNEGFHFDEIAYFLFILSSKATTPLGSLYLQHEWSDIEGTHPDHADKCLTSLESAGKIVRDGYFILVRSWMRRNCFTNPKYLKAGLYPLQNEITSPLLRFVIGSELLRLDLVSMPQQRAENLHASAALLWEEITGRRLPRATSLSGDLANPNTAMIVALTEMPGVDQAIDGLNARAWAPVKDELRRPLQDAIGGASTVTPIARSQ